jgi:Lon protease-like protein
VLALKAELAEPAVHATIELSDDPALGSFQVAAVAPIGPADQQRLLQAQGPDERLHLLDMLLTEESDYLAARLQMG